MKDDAMRLRLSVRDYECDMQGVVNNAVYQNYLEHARHVFLRERGIDFAALTRSGIHLVVTRAELDYRHSLCSGDDFDVLTRLVRSSRLRFAFEQEILICATGRTAVKALITGAALNEAGRPFLPQALLALISASEDEGTA